MAPSRPQEYKTLGKKLDCGSSRTMLVFPLAELTDFVTSDAASKLNECSFFRPHPLKSWSEMQRRSRPSQLSFIEIVERGCMG